MHPVQLGFGKQYMSISTPADFARRFESGKLSKRGSPSDLIASFKHSRDSDTHYKVLRTDESSSGDTTVRCVLVWDDQTSSYVIHKLANRVNLVPSAAAPSPLPAPTNPDTNGGTKRSTADTTNDDQEPRKRRRPSIVLPKTTTTTTTTTEAAVGRTAGKTLPASVLESINDAMTDDQDGQEDDEEEDESDMDDLADTINASMRPPPPPDTAQERPTVGRKKLPPEVLNMDLDDEDDDDESDRSSSSSGSAWS